MFTRARSLLPALVVAAAVALTVPAAASARPCPGALSVPTSATLAQAKTVTLCLLNNQRAARGMVALRPNGRLQIAAERHSGDMVRRNYFAHLTPAGVDVLHRILSVGGYLESNAGWAIGENIAWGSGDYARPAAIVGQWMRSPGHRANILNRRYREIGIGIAPGAPADTHGYASATYTTDFGRR